MKSERLSRQLEFIKPSGKVKHPEPATELSDGGKTAQGSSKPKIEYSLLNRPFILVCLSSMLFSASYNMLIPELPAYLSQLGGAELKGLIISLFTLTAGLSRPLSGKLIDTVGRKPVLMVGTIVCLICGLLYPALGTVAGFLLLRLLHGFSTGFTPTAATAYVSDIVPPKHWGAAFGWQGLFFGLGLALGPALGSLIRLYYSFDVLFYGSSLIALAALAIVINLKETLSVKKPLTAQTLKISRKNILAPEAIPPATVTFLTYLAFGMVLTLIPDWSEHLGIVYKGLFFIIFTGAALLIRLAAGRMSDDWGRVPLIYGGLIILLTSLIIMGFFQTVGGLVAAAVAYGLAMGVLSPALSAWTVDLSRPELRGRTIATMYIGMEAGIGMGALVSGFYYQSVISRIPQLMFGCAVMTFLAVVYLYMRYPRATKEMREAV